MTLPRSVAEVITHHVTWELEGIDRMYLNLYVPGLQSEGGVVHFFREHRGQPFASSALMDPISKRFRAAVAAFVEAEGIPLITFHPGERLLVEGHPAPSSSLKPPGRGNPSRPIQRAETGGEEGVRRRAATRGAARGGAATTR